MSNGFKNIQVIDGAINCVYDIFAVTVEKFNLIFPPNTDIAFIDEVLKRLTTAETDTAFGHIWERRLRKNEVIGIHGIFFYELEVKKQFYPTRRDEEAINPDGTLLR